MHRIYLFSLFLIYCNLVGTRGQEGVPCETPSEEYGICISIYDCKQLMDLLLTQSSNRQVRTFLRQSQCGSVGSTPLVCCTQRQEQNPIFTSTENAIPKINTASSLPEIPNCGRSNVTVPRVVNGVPAKLGEFPWIVALGYKNVQNPDAIKWLCGGTLITERHILTAAHCVYNRNDLYLARLGELDLYDDNDGADPETIPLIKAKVHEGYSPVNFTNDIAILTLERNPKKTTAWPICLPLSDNLRRQNFINSRPTVAGWGSLYFNGPSSSHLQEVIIPVVDNEQCNRVFGTRSVIDNRVLCAGYARGGKDACQGDSGGPLMHRQKVGNDYWFVQIGVVSYGLRCAEAGYPGVYTRVTAFLDWIQRNIN